MKLAGYTLRICCIALALMLCIGLLAACDSSKTDEASSGDPATSEPEVSRSEYMNENGMYVAKTSGNTYGGKTFTILVCSVNPTYQSELLMNDYSDPLHETVESARMPEILNKAQGDRIDYVEEQLDIVFAEEFVHDTSRPGGGMATRIRNDALAFTADYQMVVPCLYDGATLAQENAFYDLYSLPGFQSEAPWWDQAFQKEMTIDGKLYFTIGDIGTGNKSNTAALTWNKSLYDRYNLDSKYGGTPYDFVRNGTWTIDLAVTLAKEFSEDLNNDGQIDYQDLVGWEGQMDDMWSLFYGSGARIASAEGTADGYPKLTMYTERNANVMDKIQNLVLDPTIFVNANNYFGVTTWPTELLRDNFIAGNALFYNGSMATPLELGSMEDDYGLVPIPKGDEMQESYNSLVNPWTASCFAIPVWVPESDLVMVSDVLNAMGAASANILAPVYLDQCLESMKSRDDDTKDMIENYILPGRSTDIGLVYQWGGLGTMLHNMATEAYRGTFTSTYQSLEPAAQAALQETIAAFQSMTE